MDQVKLTIRLPRRLHDRLRRQARRSQRSLNALIVESLSRDAAPSEPGTEADSVKRVLAASGLWAPLDSESLHPAADTEEPSRVSLRRQLQHVPPLSDVVVEGRGER